MKELCQNLGVWYHINQKYEIVPGRETTHVCMIPLFIGLSNEFYIDAYTQLWYIRFIDSN